MRFGPWSIEAYHGDSGRLAGLIRANLTDHDRERAAELARSVAGDKVQLTRAEPGKGSLYVTRPTLGTYVATPEKLKAAADELLGLVQKKKIKVHIAQRYGLAEAAAAQTALAARKTTGATVFMMA